MTSSPTNSLAYKIAENMTFAKEWEPFLNQFTTLYNQFSKAINARDIALYEETEVVNGQMFFGANPQTKRTVYRKCFPITAIAIGAVLNIPHGIDNLTSFTRMYGTIVTSVPDDRPLPYVDAAVVTNQVSVLRNGANIVIQNGATSPAITSGYLIAEYFRS